MLSRAILSGRSRLITHSFSRSRTLATKSGLQEERTKQVVEDIKRLQYQLESRQKQTSAPFEKVDDQEIAAIYKELAAPIPVKPKISPNYLESLRLKFLDTRPLVEAHETPALTDGSVTQPNALINEEEKKKAMQDLSVEDFEQLIYANALAKRPKEAQQAFDLMPKYNLTPSVKAVNHLMDAYANTNNLDQVVSLFKGLDHMGLKADMYTYASLIKAFVGNKRLDDAFVLFEKMKEMTLIPSQPIFSSLISGCLKSNQLDRAWQVFDSMRLSYHQPDEVSFTLMLHACAKQGEVERALNLFEDMAGHHLYPTDVTFNVLINACAKRPDYYNEAFSLLDQMQSSYGFSPDRITFNTLLMACARKKDLAQARRILDFMWQDAHLSPDHHTYTNLFWCYASHHPSPSSPAIPKDNKTSTALSTEHTFASRQSPTTRSQVIQEAHWLFKQIPETVERTSGLLNAYLAIHVSHKQPVSSCLKIYHQLFNHHKVQRDAFTFSHMLDYCYKTKNHDLAWKVWEDYQDFLEERIKSGQSTLSLSEQKAKENQAKSLAIKEGWTDQQQQQLAVLMANTLGR
ncbi:hypothetical protein BD560DRAFT_385227 [Blakeslea trispora]|nr:hypothetical protein BD560DRAFT_385227 [Blakeslea trispora]